MYYSWEGVIAPAQCEKIIEEYKDKKCSEGVVGKEEKVDSSIRCSLVHWLDADDLLNRAITSFMVEANEKFFKYNMTGSETIQFATYKAGGKYDWHKDVISGTAETLRKLSTTVQLSNSADYEGGKLELFNGDKSPEDLKIMKQGSVIVFDSLDWHRLTPVTKGIRYSLAQWSYGRRFV